MDSHYCRQVTASDALDAHTLRREVVRPGGLWRAVDVVAETGSTNADLADRARSGEPSGAVLVTDFQSAGKGRQGRVWTAPPGSSIAMSILVRPNDVEPRRWSWLPLLAGLAVADGVQGVTGVPTGLKWPNDVQVEGRKISGILAERVETPDGPACVIGMGINVHLSADELPVPTATSVALVAPGRPQSRQQLIQAVLQAFEIIFNQWESAVDDTAFVSAYASRCVTIGRRVRVVLAAESTVEGVAEGIDHDGRLLVNTMAGRRIFSAGDIEHLR